MHNCFSHHVFWDVNVCFCGIYVQAFPSMSLCPLSLWLYLDNQSAINSWFWLVQDPYFVLMDTWQDSFGPVWQGSVSIIKITTGDLWFVMMLTLWWNFAKTCSVPRASLPVLMQYVMTLIRHCLWMLFVTVLSCQVLHHLVGTAVYLSTAEDLLLIVHLIYLFLGIVALFIIKFHWHILMMYFLTYLTFSVCCSTSTWSL